MAAQAANMEELSAGQLEALFRMRGFNMGQPALDELMSGGSIYCVDSYDGDFVEVQLTLDAMPLPHAEGWGLICWRRNTIIKLHAGLGLLVPGGQHWVWSRCSREIIRMVLDPPNRSG